MKHILKCPSCHTYTLEEKCECGGTPIIVTPAKYSLDDKYASQRRQAKRKATKPV